MASYKGSIKSQSWSKIYISYWDTKLFLYFELKDTRFKSQLYPVLTNVAFGSNVLCPGEWPIKLRKQTKLAFEQFMLMQIPHVHTPVRNSNKLTSSLRGLDRAISLLYCYMWGEYMFVCMSLVKVTQCLKIGSQSHYLWNRELKYPDEG